LAELKNMDESSGMLLRRYCALLADRVEQAGHPVERRADDVHIRGTDLFIAPTSIWDNPEKPEPGKIRTFGLKIGMASKSLFGGLAHEYSYGLGLDDDAAAADALQRWVDFDLPVLMESSTGDLKTCARCNYTLPETSGVARRKWHIFLGPMFYLAGSRGAQPCCSACLFTASAPVLLSRLNERVSHAVKIVASKDLDGTTSADCRVNGENWPEAIEAIAEAAKSWPDDCGLILRRQYLFFKLAHPLQ
jgi:Family of unknown function (DUF6348)